MSHVTSLNKICEWFYKLPVGCSKRVTNQFVTKPYPLEIGRFFYL
jgi:hypothetical protein